MIDTDYLILGAGASGLAFADSVLAHADVDVVLVDRRLQPGGHWRDAYPFVRLHSPSAYYGVDSMALGRDQLIETGFNEGFYEQANSSELCDYFERVVAERLAPTGRARFLAGFEHIGADGDGQVLRRCDSAEVHRVHVRRSVVDARYQEGEIPATHKPSFDVAAAAAFVPVNRLPEKAGAYRRFTIIGAGKTSVDACLWLIENGVDADRIRWIRPRDAWFHDRASLQPLAQVAGIMEGISLDAEAAAAATDLAELFERLEACGRMLRLDPKVAPTMYRGTMISQRELAALRTIVDVVRLGRVRSLEADRIVLEAGVVPTSAEVLHVDCSARGLRDAPPLPIFSPGRIVLQQVRHLSPTFNAALLAFVEAHRDTDEEKNRLCPPNPYPNSIDDWGSMMSRTWMTEFDWLSERDLGAWVAASRLNLLRALPEHAGEPRARQAIDRYLENVGPAIERLQDMAAARAAR